MKSVIGEDIRKNMSLFGIKLDRDGFYFIDYLSCIHEYEKRHPGKELKGKEKFKNFIEENLRKYKEQENFISKYFWLANYYNDIFSKEGYFIDVDTFLKP